ncbi:hypothetical protein EV363DRAFT_1495138 [Boletus edulis]|nr:hypothetical protein EV363DRAFT_1495138 [Boletus edulis]
MDPPYRPPNLFNDDSDSSEVYVPSTSTRASEKQKPLDRDEVDPRYRTSYHVHSQVQDNSSSDSDSDSDFGSDLTPSPPSISVDARGVTAVEFDGDEENSLDDRMDIDADAPPLQRDELDVAYSINRMYRILDLMGCCARFCIIVFPNYSPSRCLKSIQIG